MPSKLRDTVAVVTGASSGIGRATALEFASQGATVVIAARQRGPLDEVVTAIADAGGQAWAETVDVTDADAVERLAAEVIGRYGRIDTWVNNAAVNLFARVEEAPVELWHRVVEVNLFGAFHGARAVLPYFREQGSGVLVNVSSVLGKVPSPYQSAYVASKHGVRALSDSIRQEVEDAGGIAVCTVLPGAIDTPLFQHAGNFTGWRVKPIRPVISAERVAQAIVGCARRPRREVAVGASTRFAIGSSRAAPHATRRVAAMQIDKDHFGTEPAEPTAGNVAEPLDGEAAVSGGWKATQAGGRRTRALVAVTGLAAVAAIAARLRTRP